MKKKIPGANLFRAIILTAVAGIMLNINQAQAVDLDPLGVPLCFGFVSSSSLGLSGAEEVDGTAGVEILLADVDNSIKLDGDMDGLATATQFVKLTVLEHDGSVKWAKTLGLNSNEVVSASPFFTGVQVGTLFDATNTLGIEFIPTPTVCSSATVLDVGGQKVIAVVIGTAAPTGNLSSGADLTKINVWVLRASDGLTLAVHAIRPRSGRYVLVNQSQFIDFDDDGDDELVVVWGDPREPVGNKQTFDLLVVVYGLTSELVEENFRLFPKVTFENLNPVLP